MYIALENIRSLYNVGAMFRTCSFFGFNNVLLIGYSGTITLPSGKKELHPKLLKASLGSEKSLSITFLDSAPALRDFCSSHQCSIVSVEQSPSSVSLVNFVPSGDTVFVFGNEVTGVSEEVLQISKQIIEIKGGGTHNSLNVATSCGIVLQHLKAFTN